MTKPLRYIFGIVGTAILVCVAGGAGVLIATGIAYFMGWL